MAIAYVNIYIYIYIYIACHTCCSECSGPEDFECNLDQCDRSNSCYPLEVISPIPSTGDEVNINSTICLYMCQHPTENLFFDNSNPSQEICRGCHPNCKICYGNQANTCIECIPPKLLTDEKECLYENCLPYPNTFEAEIKCEKCISKCRDCKNSPAYCLDCQPPYLFFHEANSCLDNCPDQFYGNRTMAIPECQCI